MTIDFKYFLKLFSINFMWSVLMGVLIGQQMLATEGSTHTDYGLGLFFGVVA